MFLMHTITLGDSKNKFKVKSEILIFDDFGDFGGFFTILWSGAPASPDLENNCSGRYNCVFQSKWLFSELRWSCESVRMIYRVGNPGRTNLRVLRELSDHSGKSFCQLYRFLFVMSDRYNYDLYQFIDFPLKGRAQTTRHLWKKLS